MLGRNPQTNHPVPVLPLSPGSLPWVGSSIPARPRPTKDGQPYLRIHFSISQRGPDLLRLRSAAAGRDGLIQARLHCLSDVRPLGIKISLLAGIFH